MVFKPLCCTNHGSTKKAPAGSSLTEMKRLVIDYRELNKQLSKVQMVQAKAYGATKSYLIMTITLDVLVRFLFILSV